MSQQPTDSLSSFEIFAACAPGLEGYLLAEIEEAKFADIKRMRGGISFTGGWPEVWRANLTLRGASKILARIVGFRAFHLAQLDKRSRKFPWGQYLTSGHKVKVEVVTNRKSKIYHAGAAIERIERAITEEFGSPIATSMDEAEIIIKTRIDDNNVMFSIDTSGIGLHKRGHKQAMGKAPLRETMAALLLRSCGYTGNEPVMDPMCGSGTLIIEAAEIARTLMPGRTRRFSFEKLASYDADIIEDMKKNWMNAETDQKFYGSDRNVNVIRMANENAARSGVDDICEFRPIPISAIVRPEGPPGLVVVNPPYGERVGKKKDLVALYTAFGDVMRERFTGWRVGMVTSDMNLAKETQLPWQPLSPPIAHGGLKVRFFHTKPL